MLTANMLSPKVADWLVKNAMVIIKRKLLIIKSILTWKISLSCSNPIMSGDLKALECFCILLKTVSMSMQDRNIGQVLCLKQRLQHQDALLTRKCTENDIENVDGYSCNHRKFSVLHSNKPAVETIKQHVGRRSPYPYMVICYGKFFYFFTAL